MLAPLCFALLVPTRRDAIHLGLGALASLASRFWSLLLAFTALRALPAGISETQVRITRSSPGAAVAQELYGHDLEFTRHDLFEGLSAEMLANRKFATLADASSWPAPVQQLAAAGIGGAARWEAIGNATLDTLLWANASHLVSGDLGHSVRCAPGDCGVAQRGWLDGFDAGASYGSAIAVEAGVDYSLRLVLKSAGHGGVVVA